MASCGGGSQPFASGGRDPARQALRPGREELAITEPPAEAQAEVDDGEGSAGPGEPKTATVERREASVPDHGTQDASKRLVCCVSRRSAHPSIRVSEAKMQNPGAEVRRGNDEVFVMSAAKKRTRAEKDLANQERFATILREVHDRLELWRMVQQRVLLAKPDLQR